MKKEEDIKFNMYILTKNKNNQAKQNKNIYNYLPL
jgi:hypothetical protein